MTECNQDSFSFAPVFRREVVARFDAGPVSSDGGALLLREVAGKINLLPRLTACFTDGRDPGRIEHTVEQLLSQRLYALALGYEDLNDHDTLRFDPLLALLSGKREPNQELLASKSTLNRLELTRPSSDSQAQRYQRILFEPPAADQLLLQLFVEAHRSPPQEIVLDLDATDDPLHGKQEGRFFHGYYDHYCYWPLYIFCGDHLLCARLRTAEGDASAGALEEVQRIVSGLASALVGRSHHSAGGFRLLPGRTDALVRKPPGRLRPRAGPQPPSGDTAGRRPGRRPPAA
jgi:hypothetical protein